MRLFPKVDGKGFYSFDVLGIDTKDIVEDGDPQEAHSKNRTTRTKIVRKTYKRLKNKKPHHCLLVIGSLQETTPWKMFLEILRRE